MSEGQRIPAPYPSVFPNQYPPSADQPGYQVGCPYPFWNPEMQGQQQQEQQEPHPPELAQREPVVERGGEGGDQPLSWVACNSSGPPPPNAVQTKSGGIYVIRGRYRDDLVPGKWVQSQRKGYIPYDGKEIPVENPEFLCIPKEHYCWIKSGGGEIPAGAVQGGVTSEGEPLYVAKWKVNKEKCTGKLHPSHKCAYFSWGGKEHAEKEYKVLCTV
ncbi:unnamed protein product [Calicophoron daubneyi]|uniref:Uncharacterized protein n=1 Tax=Calicophoron daubneyi TaxID=300641 RepID=A0AAV2T0E4_CALDB